MIRPANLFLTAFAVLLLATAGARAQPADPTGEWLVEKRIARIKIVNCDNRLWGVVSWEATPGGIDSRNPDPQKRNRPTLGMPVLLGMQQTDANEWKGEVYNAENGKTYSANISLVNPDVLKVQGCVLGILCGGENWTRVNMPTPPSPPQHSGPPQHSPKSAAKAATPNPLSDDAICSGITGAAGPGLSH